MGQKARPAADVVIAEGTCGNVQFVSSFVLTSTASDLATQLRDLSAGLRSGLAGAGVERVVVRRADTPRGSNQEGPRLRLLAEGALAAAAKELVDDVVLLKAKEIARRTLAGSKEALRTEADLQLPGVTEAAADAAVGAIGI